MYFGVESINFEIMRSKKKAMQHVGVSSCVSDSIFPQTIPTGKTLPGFLKINETNAFKIYNYLYSISQRDFSVHFRVLQRYFMVEFISG